MQTKSRIPVIFTKSPPVLFIACNMEAKLKAEINGTSGKLAYYINFALFSYLPLFGPKYYKLLMNPQIQFAKSG
ncbi:hypothetical protein D1970_09600 [Mesobacillus zeae]|uniref:Uncharacterized protein n=1 Tax=Mesobacillus zeae TaxID=1917180 RepID=A0A398B6P6_9BACI|nr:hypothetical protein D1970_09600 [Mesobacillus zeae]